MGSTITGSITRHKASKYWANLPTVIYAHCCTRGCSLHLLHLRLLNLNSPAMVYPISSSAIIFSTHQIQHKIMCLISQSAGPISRSQQAVLTCFAVFTTLKTKLEDGREQSLTGCKPIENFAYSTPHLLAPHLLRFCLGF